MTRGGASDTMCDCICALGLMRLGCSDPLTQTPSGACCAIVHPPAARARRQQKQCVRWSFACHVQSCGHADSRFRYRHIHSVICCVSPLLARAHSVPPPHVWYRPLVAVLRRLRSGRFPARSDVTCIDPRPRLCPTASHFESQSRVQVILALVSLAAMYLSMSAVTPLQQPSVDCVSTEPGANANRVRSPHGSTLHSYLLSHVFVLSLRCSPPLLVRSPVLPTPCFLLATRFAVAPFWRLECALPPGRPLSLACRLGSPSSSKKRQPKERSLHASVFERFEYEPCPHIAPNMLGDLVDRVGGIVVIRFGHMYSSEGGCGAYLPTELGPRSMCTHPSV